MDYENWPSFCGYYEHSGHAKDECFKKDPSLKPIKPIKVDMPRVSQVYVLKEQVDKEK